MSRGAANRSLPLMGLGLEEPGYSGKLGCHDSAPRTRDCLISAAVMCS